MQSIMKKKVLRYTRNTKKIVQVQMFTRSIGLTSRRRRRRTVVYTGKLNVLTTTEFKLLR